MPNLTVVGHFSTWLLVAWVVWLLWAVAQAVWYRRVRDGDADVVSIAPARMPRLEATTGERSGTLPAPGIPLRTMTPAAPAAAAGQFSPVPAVPTIPTVNPAESSPEHDDITPS